MGRKTALSQQSLLLAPPDTPIPQDLTVAELGVIYMEHARNYYRLTDGRHFQALLSPDSLHPLVFHPPAFSPQKGRNPASLRTTSGTVFPRANSISASRSFPMICSAGNFFPRGIFCPPLACTTEGSSL